MTKRTITVKTGYDITNDLDGSIDDAIKHLVKLRDEEGYNNLDVDYYSDYKVICPRILREETDEEYQARLNEEAKQNAKCKAHRRAEYERLKKEFE